MYLLAHSLSNVDLCHWHSAVGAPATNKQQFVERAQLGAVAVRDLRFFWSVRIKPILPRLQLNSFVIIHSFIHSFLYCQQMSKRIRHYV